ncbi:MAG: hypothetical protein KDB27_16380 [Planctomycetales bacterium]|nr:hypothetical protein [Planctomycetales bacterium]
MTPHDLDAVLDEFSRDSTEKDKFRDRVRDSSYGSNEGNCEEAFESPFDHALASVGTTLRRMYANEPEGPTAWELIFDHQSEPATSIDLLLKRLSDDCEVIRSLSIYLLGYELASASELARRRIVAGLGTTLSDSSPLVRSAALFSIAHAGRLGVEINDEIAEAVADLLSDDDLNVQGSAMSSIRFVGPAGKKASPVLLARLRKLRGRKHAFERVWLTEVLCSVDPATVESLLESSSESLRMDAYLGISGGNHEASFIPHIVRLRDDSFGKLRSYARRKLVDGTLAIYANDEDLNDCDRAKILNATPGSSQALEDPLLVFWNRIANKRMSDFLNRHRDNLEPCELAWIEAIRRGNGSISLTEAVPVLISLQSSDNAEVRTDARRLRQLFHRYGSGLYTEFENSVIDHCFGHNSSATSEQLVFDSRYIDAKMRKIIKRLARGPLRTWSHREDIRQLAKLNFLQRMRQDPTLGLDPNQAFRYAGYLNTALEWCVKDAIAVAAVDLKRNGKPLPNPEWIPDRSASDLSESVDSLRNSVSRFLSTEELKVFNKLIQRKSQRVIAEELNETENHVKTLITNIRKITEAVTASNSK